MAEQRNESTIYHTPVMLSECLEGMQIRPDGCYLDVTMGGGGHSRAILSRLGAGGRLYAVDQDADAVSEMPPCAGFTFIASNFRHIARFMDYYGELGRVDAILADLGVSSHHFDTPERGFSFRSADALLDMRMNARSGTTARDVLASYEEDALARLFYEYGELRQSKRIAHAIVTGRAEAPITTVDDLLQLVRPLINPREEKKQLSQLFQALRIEVNDELEALGEMLDASQRILRPGGRLVVMTYHSLEDRIVKSFLKTSARSDDTTCQIYGATPSPWHLITRKPMTPSTEEIHHNPRARSAKLRIAEWQGYTS